jgi:asparagine synthase (glutamine-hydrolysing)
MCGIAGIFEFNGQKSVDEKVLLAMRDCLAHRGPDDAGHYISGDETVGLGHRRLSIIDLSEHGRQPMSTDSGDMWIVFNGEIYNHENLRLELEKSGYKYHSQSDTETLLYLFKEHGKECLGMLEGMFSFAIYDVKTKKLFAARDRLGVKPFYYSSGQGRFLFGSEPKAILEHPAIAPELNEEALYHFMSFICTPPPLTLFKGIFKLPPATCMQVGERGIEFIERYWEPYENSRNDVKSEEDYVKEIRTLLKDATKKRMMSDVPFGAFLSGGIDSSLNVAYMTELLNRPVDTFTVGFSTKGSEKFNEFEPARQVASEFRSNHTEVSVDTESIIDELSGFMRQQDDPVAHPVCIPFYMMCKKSKESRVTVVQVGEGSDEVFIGYDRFISELKTVNGWKWKLFCRLPKLLRKVIYQIEKFMNPGVNDYFNPSLEYSRRATDGEEIFWGGLMCFPEDVKRRIFSKRFLNKIQGISTYDKIIRPIYEKIRRDIPDADKPQCMSYVEMQLRLPEHLLMRVDKMSMAHGVEARVPFLDHKLVESVFNMPESIKISGGAKSILKKAARGVIPDNIIDRKKQGFSAPSTNWLRECENEFERALLNSSFSEADIFDKKFLSDMVDGLKKEPGWDLHRWCVYVIARWYDYWISVNK